MIHINKIPYLQGVRVLVRDLKRAKNHTEVLLKSTHQWCQDLKCLCATFGNIFKVYILVDVNSALKASRFILNLVLKNGKQNKIKSQSMNVDQFLKNQKILMKCYLLQEKLNYIMSLHLDLTMIKHYNLAPIVQELFFQIV